MSQTSRSNQSAEGKTCIKDLIGTKALLQILTITLTSLT